MSVLTAYMCSCAHTCVCVRVRACVCSRACVWFFWGGLHIWGIHKKMVRFQKVIQNSFLTLHGHNIHCQQRELPKFLMRTSSLLLMLTAGLRDQFQRWCRSRRRLPVCSVLRCPDLWLHCNASFVHSLKKDTPHKYNITRWYRQFVETGLLCEGRIPAWSTLCVWWQQWKSAWGISAKSPQVSG
jgi:hypothetical protein